MSTLAVPEMPPDCRGDSCDQSAFSYDSQGAISASAAITLTEVTSGLEYPTDIAHAGDGRLFIVEKPGRIRIYDGSSLLVTPFLDIDALVTGGTTSNSEQGLLGVVFHPDYATNGYFYVNYTFGSGDSRIARYEVSEADANVADPTSATTILEVAQPFVNHNGGDLSFGPDDGYLYIGLGDGGSSGDPNDNGQDNSQLLGKILRIDVDGSGGAECDASAVSNYDIPADNPLVDGAGGNCDEIWSTGLRNPWRFSFDNLTADMWIADVGQYLWEEVNFQEADSAGGENWGWRCYEGNAVYDLTGCGPISSYVFPLIDYPHGGSPYKCSITGGFVYRGADVPALAGHYLYADYCSNQFWSISAGSRTQLTSFGVPNVTGTTFANPTSFGEDVNGELYVAENGSSASIFKITAATCDLCAATQNINLSAGWNMVSSFVDPSNPILESLLGDIDEHVVLMKNDKGQVYWPSQGINTIGDWHVLDGYQIMLDSGQTVIIGGIQIDPPQTEIDLPAGWSMVSYLRDNDTAIDQALDSISSELKLAKNGAGQVYWPEFDVNQINNMQSGQGYQLFMDNSGTLIYPVN